MQENNNKFQDDDNIGDFEEKKIVENGDVKTVEETSIHTTNGEDDEFNDGEFSEFNNKPRRNLVTGIPESEFETERKTTITKKKGAFALIAVTVAVVVCILAIVVFFILRGKSDYNAATNVKDNSLKTGVNSNSSSQLPDFQTDYSKRYGENTNGAFELNANTNNPALQPGMPGYGTVGSNITAPPPPSGANPNGGIYQPGQMQQQVAPPPTQASSGGSGGGSSSGGGNSGGGGSSGGGGNGSSGGSRQPVETVRINPDRNTEVVELPENQARQQSNGLGRNDQVSLYFYDRPNASSDDAGRISKIEYERNAIARPNFGTVLPVKMLGRLHTLGTNGLARMELTRAVEGSWGTLPRGTLFVGRVAGGEANRLFVSLLGYIEPRSNRLVTLGGDLQGKDGALGIEGDVKRVGSQWKKVFGGLLSTAKEIGTAYLLGRSGGSGTVINNGQLSQIPNALDGKETTKFVLVPAGSQGYIVINDLPPAIESDERLGSSQDLTDDDILKMIQTQSPQDIERIIPQLSPRGQQIARGAVGK